MAVLALALGAGRDLAHDGLDVASAAPPARGDEVRQLAGLRRCAVGQSELTKWVCRI